MVFHSKVSPLVQKLAQKLFIDSGERESFEEALTHPKAYPESILWRDEKKQLLGSSMMKTLPPRPEQPEFVSRLVIEENPGKSELHKNGSFYILDYSSVLAAIPLLEVPKQPDCILDLCAAPGGKSIFAWRALNPKQLISNEVAEVRRMTLKKNLERCQLQNVRVTASRLDWWVQNASDESQVVILDAPCSGQSLLAKGERPQGAFHPAIINGNSNRQKRLIAQASELVSRGGHLLYSTCTYSQEENERVALWFLKRFTEFAAIGIQRLESFQSRWSDFPCYRLFPQSGLGAGAFTVLFQRGK